jgi:stage II sporulation protein D
MGSLKLMRRLLLPVALLAALVFATSADARALFVVKGRGWGHGVGLSQWGAYGMARDGATYQQILGHYFRDTTLGNRTGTIRVLLADGRSSVRIGSSTEFAVGTRTHAAGNPLVEPTSTGRIKVGGFKRSFDSPVAFRSLDAPVALNGSAYHGRFVVSVVGGRLRVVNAVGLESYVKGVVTHESLAWWGDVGAQAALEAQAVAARSYALSGPGHCADGTYCPTTFDQVYGPIATETANGRAAVDATAHKVVLYGGNVARTFFSSSSGGRTAASEDVFVTALPYLRSEDDPADLNSYGAGQTNPNRSWRVLFTPRELAAKLGTPRPNDAVVTNRSSGRVRGLRVEGPGWAQDFSGKTDFFRNALDLKSARFWLGMQSIYSNKKESRCRRAVTLDVFAHGVGAISAEQRTSTSSTWTTIPLSKVAAGHWRVTRHPCTSIDYRVRSSEAAGPAVHVSVSPDVAFDETQRADALTGRVHPALAGNPLAVQRQTPSGWTAAANTTIAADGTFQAAFAVQEGVYRARVVPRPSTGLVTGYSPVLHAVTG